MNCSKYFSLNPANGNLKALGFPSFVVYWKIIVSLNICTWNRLTVSLTLVKLIRLGVTSNISPLEDCNSNCICAIICPRFCKVSVTGSFSSASSGRQYIHVLGANSSGLRDTVMHIP